MVMKKLQKKFKSVGAAVLSVCLALAGLSTGGYPKSQAATLTYETIYTISDFSTTTNLGMSNVTLDTANYRSGPSSVKFSAAEGSSTSLWRTTYPEPIDLSVDGKYTKDNLGLAFWVYIDTTETDYVYTIQLASATNWGKAATYNKWRNTLTTSTGKWSYVVIPLKDAANFDITNFCGFRIFQATASAKPAHTFHIDDFQIVNMNSSHYSWESTDVELSTSLNKDNLMYDDEFTLNCTVKNKDTAIAMNNWTMKAAVNERLLKIKGNSSQKFSVEAEKITELTIPLQALEGGEGKISMEFYDENDHLIVSREVPITIGGKRNWAREDIDFSMSWSQDTPTAGDTIALQYSLTNKSKTADIDNWTISCRYSPLWITADTDSHNISVSAAKTFAGEFAFTFEEGGSGLVLLDIRDGKNNLISSESIPVTASGTGYYLGDAHTHTTASDGKGTFLENFQAARKQGMSWIYTADHNADMAYSYDRVNFDTANQAMNTKNFLAVYGTEVTTHMGHMVLHDVDDYYISESTESKHNDIPTGITAKAWQDLINCTIKDNIISWLGHPFATTPYPGLSMEPNNTDVYTGFTGIEIINLGESVGRYGGNTVSSTLKVYATEYWDRMNIKGEKKYFGISNTDAHVPEDVGLFYNGLLMEELSEDSINTSLATGSFYGSAGPELRFSLGSKTMGQTVYAGKGTDVPISVKAYSKDAPITKVALYAFDINEEDINTAYISGRENVTLLFEDKDGSKNQHAFEYIDKLPLKDNTFYRVEVYTDDELYGYAFSNPIWMEQGTEPASQYITAKENTFLIRDGQLIISNPPSDLTVSECLAELMPASGVFMYENDRPVSGETRIKDGMTVRLVAGKDVLDELTVVLRSGILPQKPDTQEDVTGCFTPTEMITDNDLIYTISDFSKSGGIGTTNASYDPKNGAKANGSFSLKSGASIWKTGSSIDLSPYTDGNNDNLALSFWFKTDMLTAGNRYTIQMTSSGSWGTPCMTWNFDPTEFTSDTNSWSLVVLPFAEASGTGFDMSSYMWFRFFQNNETTDEFSLWLDDIQIVRCGKAPVYDTVIPGDRLELLQEGVAGQQYTIDQQSSAVILSNKKLIPAPLSGSKQAYLSLDLFITDAQAIDFSDSSIRASFGKDTANAMTWEISNLKTGWNRLVLPIAEGKWEAAGVTSSWSGNGPSYLYNDRIVCSLDNLTLQFAGNNTSFIIGDAALYLSEREKPIMDPMTDTNISTDPGTKPDSDADPKKDSDIISNNESKTVTPNTGIHDIFHPIVIFQLLFLIGIIICIFVRRRSKNHAC